MKVNGLKKAPLPTVRRLPAYLHLLQDAFRRMQISISATDIAEALHLESIQVRKDLSYTGIVGKPRIGYQVKELIDSISGFLGWNRQSCAVLVGAGSLGAALMGFNGFSRHGLQITAAFDVAPDKIGQTLHGRPVFHLEELQEQQKLFGARIGILTVPPAVAQQTAEKLVATGIEAIWNFSPATLTLPEQITVQQEDLSAGLAVLTMQLGQ